MRARSAERQLNRCDVITTHFHDQRIASPDAIRFPLPGQAQPEAVAAGVNPGTTSWLPLTARQAEAGKLGTVLVPGVTGMSGGPRRHARRCAASSPKPEFPPSGQARTSPVKSATTP